MQIRNIALNVPVNRSAAISACLEVGAHQKLCRKQQLAEALLPGKQLQIPPIRHIAYRMALPRQRACCTVHEPRRVSGLLSSVFFIQKHCRTRLFR
jgi:hypothetical protein